MGAAALYVAISLLRPAPEVFTPSPILALPPEAPPEGEVVRTVDASHPDRWRFFSLERGSVVENPGPREWDLAFRRFQIIVNGGEGFPGDGGLQPLEGVRFGEVERLPEDGYEGTRARGDSIHPGIQRWYDYSFFSHLLTPKERVYAVRTADGRFAKVELMGYYCPGPTPGCITFRYTFLPTEG